MDSPVFQNVRLWPAQLDPYVNCAIEHRDAALARLSADSRSVFDRLCLAEPAIFDSLTFLRCRRRFHPDVELYDDDDDVVAIFDRTHGGFGISIDASSAAVTVWNEHQKGEFANWGGTSGDYVEKAIEFIRQCAAE
jgi:hypothetical protein